MGTDTRIRVTKKMIKESFIELLKTNPLNKISVTQICKKAEINRVTFYKYYQDVFDLYEKLVDELIEESAASLAQATKNKDLREAIELVLTDIYHQADQYHVLFSTHIDAYHQGKSIERCLSKISSFALPGLSVPENQRQLLRAFLSFGGGGVLATCLYQEVEQSPKEIADLLYSYIMQILKLYRER